MGFFDKLQKPGHTALRPRKRPAYPSKVRSSISPEAEEVSSLRESASSVVQDSDGSRMNRSFEASRSGRKHEASQSVKTVYSSRSSSPNAEGSGESLDEADLDSRLYDLHKRRRKATCIRECNRKIINAEAFDEPVVNSEIPVLQHAANLTDPQNTAHYRQLSCGPSGESNLIVLQYPAISTGECYQLLKPVLEDDFDPLHDISLAVQIMQKFYVKELDGEENSEAVHISRQLRREKHLNITQYVDLIKSWNSCIQRARDSGKIAKSMEVWDEIDAELVECVLEQVYSRTVSLRVHELRRYENGTNDVYGELLPSFVSKLLREDVQMTADQIFVDLGSGVGNCVLQAALEIGCAAHGCEKMPVACELAECQKVEFEARCRLWGICHGRISLERGDFLENVNIKNALRKADVILVNNQAFQAELNEHLTNLFLDLKDGARVISLKSFKVDGKSSAKGTSAVHNILSTVQKEYFSGSVSWTNAGGQYFLSTKSSKVKTRWNPNGVRRHVVV